MVTTVSPARSLRIEAGRLAGIQPVDPGRDRLAPRAWVHEADRVEHDGAPHAVVGAEPAHQVAGADEADLLEVGRGEDDRSAKAAAGQLRRQLHQGGNARSVVIGTGRPADRVVVGHDHDRLVRLAVTDRHHVRAVEARIRIPRVAATRALDRMVQVRLQVAEPEVLAPDLPARRSPGIGQERIGPFHGPRRIDAIARGRQGGDERAQVCRIDPTDPRVGGLPEGGVGRRVVGLRGARQGDLHRVEDSGQRAQCPHVRDAPSDPRVTARRELHRVGHPRDDAPCGRARRGEPRAGLSRLRLPARAQGGGQVARSTRDVNQYAITWGARDLREAIAAKTARFYGWQVDPETEVTVCCGATEAMIAAMLALVDPGDEVIVFEPFYENYGPDAILSGAVPRYVTLHEPDWRFDPDELARGVRTANPGDHPQHARTTRPARCSRGRARADRRAWRSEYDALVITDEIYEHIVYDGEHVPMATLPGMAERTVTINGLSKTYRVTGWRVGWAIAPAPLTGAIRKVHDFLTVGAAAPLQEAGRRRAGAARRLLRRARRRLPAAARPPAPARSRRPACGRSCRTAPTT